MGRANEHVRFGSEESDLGGADADFAGDGVDFDAAAAVAHAGAQGMFALLFDHDRDIGSDLAGNRFGGQVKVCVGWNS